MELNPKMYYTPELEVCDNIVVERGFFVSNMESIEDEEQSEIKW